MNNKVKEFAIKSDLCSMGTDGKIYYNNCSKDNPEPYLKEFAKLLIRECASVVEMDTDYKDCCKWCDEKILEHFGVE